ncbi:MAG: hypothetical protein LCH61_05425 [Proteobacteria bacterium]|nr:hypothetical protein [Pseudomonadota bacterium]
MMLNLDAPDITLVPPFMERIEYARKSMSKLEWKAFCAEDRQLAAWREFLCDDPYTRHALLKPRGYAGDAVVMDYAYRHSSVMRHVAAESEYGRIIYETTSGAPQSQSARDRISLIASTIERLAKDNKLRVGSFASGHARELESIKYASELIHEFVAIDADNMSLYEINNSYGLAIKIRAINHNIFRLSADNIGMLDFAYSMGLFDYLNVSAAKRTLRLISETVDRGGTLLFGNLTEEAANLGYCEAVMDWWMIPRTYDEMTELGEILERTDKWSVKVLQQGCFYYLLGVRED